MKNISYIILIICSFLSGCQKQPNKAFTINVNNTRLHLSNGVLVYDEQTFTGTIEATYIDGKPKSRTSYKEGKKEGEEIYWWENGEVATQRYYANGLKSGTHYAWWPNGNQKYTYHFNTTGQYNGSVKEWYETGTLFRDFNFINGVETGIQQLWYENGKIKANYTVIEGERFGLVGLKRCYKVTEGSSEI